MEMDSCPWSLGGILLGVKADRLEVENWETDDFFVGATIRNRLTNVRWDMITVYGPANHDFPKLLLNLYLKDVTGPTCQFL